MPEEQKRRHEKLTEEFKNQITQILVLIKLPSPENDSLVRCRRLDYCLVDWLGLSSLGSCSSMKQSL